ncbi:MAG TPA: DUF72 domain-containing protein [Gemmatimonadales bacterium]|nr:DUF72 domain-containing protein [Gemmatimonadales bacterium]
MRIAVGTSGYAYKEWKGTFYPADLPADGMLRYYGERFGTVEINNTFYRMPSEKILLAWAAEVPESFTFVLKASQKITHFKRLKDVSGEVEYFLRVANVLGPRLGPTLFQLPPNLKKDLPRLVDFLALVPRAWRAAFEFRHASWFDDEVFTALRGHNASLCVADADPAEEGDKEALQVPFVATADWGYLRLRRAGYTAADLAGWAGRVTSQAWKDAFVFFKHEEAGAGPKLAAQFTALLPRS